MCLSNHPTVYSCNMLHVSIYLSVVICFLVRLPPSDPHWSGPMWGCESKHQLQQLLSKVTVDITLRLTEAGCGYNAATNQCRAITLVPALILRTLTTPAQMFAFYASVCVPYIGNSQQCTVCLWLLTRQRSGNLKWQPSTCVCQIMFVWGIVIL